MSLVDGFSISSIYLKFYIFMCLSVLPTCMFISTCVQCLRRPDKGFGSLGTGILSGLVLPCGFWESNLSSLEEQPVFLTAEPSVQPLDFIFNIL